MYFHGVKRRSIDVANLNPNELHTPEDRERCTSFRLLFESVCYQKELECKERFLKWQEVSKNRLPLSVLFRGEKNTPLITFEPESEVSSEKPL